MNSLKQTESKSEIELDKNSIQMKEFASLQIQFYDLLYLMFAHNKYSLLIILQGIDTSGKDGVVRHLFSCSNPQGLKVYSFKKPTALESHHDFLWRCHLKTPERGLAVIFNRSYYEEVTTVQIHPKHLDEQHIPKELIDESFFKKRFKRINDFEKMLSEQGTVVIKLFLHISKKEQLKRLKERISNLSKNWKFSEQDYKERKHWDDYMDVFDQMILNTNTRWAPWFIIPADDKNFRNYFILKLLVKRLKKLSMKFPKAKFK